MNKNNFAGIMLVAARVTEEAPSLPELEIEAADMQSWVLQVANLLDGTECWLSDPLSELKNILQVDLVVQLDDIAWGFHIKSRLDEANKFNETYKGRFVEVGNTRLPYPIAVATASGGIAMLKIMQEVTALPLKTGAELVLELVSDNPKGVILPLGALNPQVVQALRCLRVGKTESHYITI